MTPRLSIIDGLKIIASQIIVLHHLSTYGPVADAVHSFLPWLFGWLFSYGRMAVQVFLVAGGFLAAQSLAPTGFLQGGKPFELLKRRYVRLSVPLVGAVMICVVCACLARCLTTDGAIPSAPSAFQLLAHVALLQDLLGQPALSAGVWYVSIDFQLYALTVLLLYVSGRMSKTLKWARFLGVLFISVAAVLSLFVFNRDAKWDVVALYHFAAYAMGLGCFWLTQHRRVPVFWMSVAVLVVAAALCLEFRERIALALAAAIVIGRGVWVGWAPPWLDRMAVKQLARESYSLFLVHFPVCLLVNAAFARLSAGFDPGWAMLAVCVAWLASIVLAKQFYRVVESRSEQILCELQRAVVIGVVTARLQLRKQRWFGLRFLVLRLPSNWAFRKS